MNKVTQKFMKGFKGNFWKMLVMGQGTDGSIFYDVLPVLKVVAVVVTVVSVVFPLIKVDFKLTQIKIFAHCLSSWCQN